MDDIIKWVSIVTAILLLGMVKKGLSFVKYLLTCKLHQAAKSGKIDKVRQEINQGADVNALDPHIGLTPLHYAIANDHLDIARLLLGSGARLTERSAYGRTPLDYAEKHFDADQIRQLLKIGIDPTVVDSAGRTSLHLAAEAGHQSLVEELIAQGWNVDATDQDGVTPLFMALVKKHSAVAQILVSRGANVNFLNRDGTPPISVAAAVGDLQSVEMLISNGAKLKVRDNDGSTPLHYAAQGGHTEVVKALLSHYTLDSPEETVLYEMKVVKRFALGVHFNCQLIFTNKNLIFKDKDDQSYNLTLTKEILNRATLKPRYNTDIIIELTDGSLYEIGLKDNQKWVVGELLQHVYQTKDIYSSENS